MSLTRISLLAIGTALMLISLASVALPPSEDFHPSNPYWNGLEEFREITKARSDIGEMVPERSALFIIGPSTNRFDIDFLKGFVFEGGTLVIMDEVGTMNSFLSEFGVEIKSGFMLDPVFYYENWKLPKLIDIENASLTNGVERIVLNLPSIIEVKKEGVRVLARSSSFSFLDLNGDFEPQREEPKGPFAIIVEATYGKGRLIVISDSSLFLNGMMSLGDNRKLLENIVRGKEVFLDENWPISLHAAYRSAVLEVYEVVSAPELKYGLALLTTALIYRLVNKERGRGEVDEVVDLIKKHPDWDEKLLRALKEARDEVEGV